jgi:hypothetical protein
VAKWYEVNRDTSISENFKVLGNVYFNLLTYTILQGGRGMQTRTPSLTRLLLLCGAIAGPFFIFIVLIQDYTRPGFDPRLDALSMLSLGDWGWVQIANFALAGMFNLLYALASGGDCIPDGLEHGDQF